MSQSSIESSSSYSIIPFKSIFINNISFSISFALFIAVLIISLSPNSGGKVESKFKKSKYIFNGSNDSFFGLSSSNLKDILLLDIFLLIEAFVIGIFWKISLLFTEDAFPQEKINNKKITIYADIF